MFRKKPDAIKIARHKERVTGCFEQAKRHLAPERNAPEDLKSLFTADVRFSDENPTSPFLKMAVSQDGKTSQYDIKVMDAGFFKDAWTTKLQVTSKDSDGKPSASKKFYIASNLGDSDECYYDRHAVKVMKWVSAHPSPSA